MVLLLGEISVGYEPAGRGFSAHSDILPGVEAAFEELRAKANAPVRTDDPA